MLASARLGGIGVVFGPSIHWQVREIAGLPSSSPFEIEVASLLIETVHIELTAEEIDPTAPLFGDGLGLDSIDALEIALAVSQRYGFELKSDDEQNHRIFASLRSLAAHIARHRTRRPAPMSMSEAS